MKFNADQEAMIYERANCVAIAGPGSGKTGASVHKAFHLIQDYGLRVGLITFTREAAEEIRQRLTQLMPRENRFTVSTFHAIAMRQLLLSQAGYEVIAPGKQKLLMSRAANQCGSPKLANEAFESLDSYRTGGQLSAELSEIIDVYIELLAHTGVDDFHSVVEKVVDGLEQGLIEPAPFDHIICDEYQDVDELQYRWIKAHTAKRVAITVVGDDDQSIYGFRRALGYQAFERLEADVGARRVVLATNYRSKIEIIQAAANVIFVNSYRADKRFTSKKGAGGTVELIEFATDMVEIEELAQRISVSPEKWAVITRINKQLDVIEMELLNRNIPYTRRTKGGFWEMRETALLLHSCESLINAQQRKDALHSILVLKGWSEKEISDASQGVGNEKLTEKLNAFRRKLNQAASSYTEEPNEAIATIAEVVCSDMDSDCAQLKHVNMAVNSLSRIRGSLKQKLQAVTQTKEEHEGVGCRLLTMHASKGLEFDRVWIPFCVEGKTPLRAPSGKESSPIEEERRLFYVAMTRAKEILLMSYAGIRLTEQKSINQTPSRFLFETGLSPSKHAHAHFIKEA